MADTVHPNMSLMQNLDIHNLDACKSLIADDFVWHYFNSKLPELEGDYLGVDGLKAFFAKLGEKSNNSFEVNVVDGRPAGDELVVIQVRNRMNLEDAAIEFDAIVVWRIVGNKLVEAWDIPAVNSVRTISKI